MRRLAGLVLLLGSVTVAIPPAKGEIGPERAALLVERAGLEDELAQIAPLLRREINGLEGELELAETPRETLTGLVDRVYSTERLVARVGAALAAALTAREADEVIDWLSSPAGRRVSSLELAAKTPGAPRPGGEFDARLEDSRRERVQALSQALGSDTASATMGIDTMIAVYAAAAWVLPAEERPPFAKLSLLLAGRRGEMGALLKGTLLVDQAFTYRDLTDSELEAYLAFARRPAARAYHRALEKALAKTLAAAGRELQTLAEAAAPDPEPEPEPEFDPDPGSGSGTGSGSGSGSGSETPPEPEPVPTAEITEPRVGRIVEIDLIVRRPGGKPIALDDWLAYIEGTPELRHRTEPYAGRNPMTGDTLWIAAGEGDAELVFEEFTTEFLSFDDGSLRGRFHLYPEDPQDPQRSRIVAVADHFGAVVFDQETGLALPW